MIGEGECAELALRLVLGAPFDHNELHQVDWKSFLHVAKGNVVVVRLSDRLAEIRGPSLDAFEAAARHERERVRLTLALIGRLSTRCFEHHIPFVMTKAFQHYPDMGNDIDVFVSERSAKVDRLLMSGLTARPIALDVCTWIANKTAYQIQGYDTPLEIHHGRVGDLGEHDVFPRLFMTNCCKAELEGIHTRVLSAADQLILQVIQRIYNHYSIRLSDVVQSIHLVREGNVDWEYVTNTTIRIGAFDGLCCYMSYIRQIHERLFEERLLPRRIECALSQRSWGRVRFARGLYRFSAAGVLPRVYATKLMHELRTQNWDSAGRLCLLPAVAVMAGARKTRRLFAWREAEAIGARAGKERVC